MDVVLQELMFTCVMIMQVVAFVARSFMYIPVARKWLSSSVLLFCVVCMCFMSGDWIRGWFETPSIMSLPYDEKRTLLARLVRATK